MTLLAGKLYRRQRNAVHRSAGTTPPVIGLFRFHIPRLRLRATRPAVLDATLEKSPSASRAGMVRHREPIRKAKCNLQGEDKVASIQSGAQWGSSRAIQ
jgi:hypothetical protein